MLIGIVGCGGFGREVMPMLSEMPNFDGTNTRAVFVDIAPTPGLFVNSHPVISENDFLQLEEQDKYFTVAIANPGIRANIAKRLIQNGARPVHIHSRAASFYDKNELGEGSIICYGSIITSNTTIGRFFHCNLMSYVAHDCVIGDFVTFAPKVACNGNVVIEDQVYIGTGALIKEGAEKRPLRIGKGAIVGMGAVVTHDIPPGETWVGNPARPLKRH